MITLNINGNKVEVENKTTIESYLVEKNINPKTVVIELNYEIPKREEWKSITLKEGDNIEIVKFIGGG